MPFVGLTEHPHFASDRYTYVGGIVIDALIAGSMWRMFSSTRIGVRWCGGTGVAIAAVFCGTCSYAQSGLWADSITLLSKIYHGKPTGRLAAVYFERGDNITALDVAEKAKEYDSGDVQALEIVGKASLLLAEAERSAGTQASEINKHLEVAAAALDAYEQFSLDAATLRLAGFAYLRLGRVSPAEDRLGRLVSMDSGNANAYLLYGNVLYLDRKPVEAEQELEKALQLSPELESNRYVLIKQWKEDAASVEQ